jgi:hypothetical protein
MQRGIGAHVWKIGEFDGCALFVHDKSTNGRENAGSGKVRAKLRPPLRDTFDRLLENYEVSAKIHTGEVSVNYDIIADLVRAGWRRA